MTDLSGPDRSWLVAGLTLAGMTAQSIADRLSCSLRLVRTIRSEEMTEVCYRSQKLEAEMSDEVRRSELALRLSRRELDRAQQVTQQVKLQLDQIIDAHMAGTLKLFPKCGHPKLDYNVYEFDGRLFCRMCAAERAASYRRRKKAPLTSSVTQMCDDSGCETTSDEETPLRSVQVRSARDVTRQPDRL